jgi:hypothetical protein
MPWYRQYAQYGVFIVIAFFMIPALSMLIRIPAEFLYHTVAGNLLGMPVFEYV